jgi:hypothetical protein
VHRDSEFDRVAQDGDLPLLIMRVCHGLSWDTPAGFDLLKAMPAVMWQMGIFNI